MRNSQLTVRGQQGSQRMIFKEQRKSTTWNQVVQAHAAQPASARPDPYTRAEERFTHNTAITTTCALSWKR